LALGGANTYDGGTAVKAGTLLLEEGASLASGALEVANAASLAGYGAVGGPATVAGSLSAGGLEDGEYGLLTFAGGLTLESAATIVFHLGDGGTAGTSYDSVAVTGGTLVLAGALEAIAASSGTYTIFNYSGASYLGDIDDDFDSVTATVGGGAANASLANNAFASVITLTVSQGNQSNETHTGDGAGSNLADSGFSQPGLVVTFTGTGETVTVIAPTSFDTFLFDSDDYVLEGGDLTIDPANGSAGIVNVNDSDYVATIENNIGGAGQSLTKVGEGLLILAGTNDYTGGTVIEAGTLQGNIVADTDLTVMDDAVYDGDGAARSIAALNGDGDIENTHGLTVASGIYGGDIGDSNDGFLKKVGPGELILTGANDYGGETIVAEGTLKGNIAVGTDLTVAAGATYDGDGEARTVGILSDAGAITNTAGLTVSSGHFSGVLDSSNTGGVIKLNSGELYLDGGNNEYAGGTFVFEGTLKGDIASGTYLTVAAGATYDGDGEARVVGILSGAGAVKNTVGLTVSSGTFEGDLDSANTGGLTKVGTGELYLDGGAIAYTGGTVVSGGTLKGDIASGTDLTVAAGAT
jgi:autotransporter-associated beta strand protein